MPEDERLETWLRESVFWTSSEERQSRLLDNEIGAAEAIRSEKELY
jgi:hypothetical protein